MKAIIKPVRKKILVVLLGMCVAMSSYSPSYATTAAANGQAAPPAQGVTAVSDHFLPYYCYYWYGFYYCYYYPSVGFYAGYYGGFYAGFYTYSYYG
jgi:hypothetical protein